jgi:hypothetical protein
MDCEWKQKNKFQYSFILWLIVCVLLFAMTMQLSLSTIRMNDKLPCVKKNINLKKM